MPISRALLPAWMADGEPGRAVPPSQQAGLAGRLARHPVSMDAAVAAGVAVASGVVDALSSLHLTHAALAWDVILAAPLILRRRAPVAAGALIAALCLVQWLVNVRATGDVAVLLALYSLGAYERRRWILATAVVVAEIGVVLAITRWGPPSDRLLPGLMATGTVTAAWVAGIYVRMRRAYLASMLLRAQTAERERDSQAQIAVAAERTRMAREMHDVIAHSLSVMITLNDAAAAVESSPQARDTITQASEVGRQALAEMHRMLGVLRNGEAAELAPSPGVGQLADLVSLVRSAGLSVELAVTGDLASLPPTAQLALYRIVQESLTNVLKHARNVRHVSVRVTRHGPDVELQVEDDGARRLPGPSGPARAAEHGGHGVAGMTERASLFGGQLQAGPRDGDGWRVSARLSLG
jgi:signal transduction histidine kinase